MRKFLALNPCADFLFQRLEIFSFSGQLSMAPIVHALDILLRESRREAIQHEHSGDHEGKMRWINSARGMCSSDGGGFCTVRPGPLVFGFG
jgi:hypothetical protein